MLDADMKAILIDHMKTIHEDLAEGIYTKDRAYESAKRYLKDFFDSDSSEDYQEAIKFVSDSLDI